MKCKRCGGVMKKGKALQNTIDWGDNFGEESQLLKPPTGTTIRETGVAEMVICLKCVKCGYSIAKGTLIKSKT